MFSDSMAVLQFCSIQSATSKSLFMTAVLYSLTDSSSRKLTNHHVDRFVAEVVAVVLRDVAQQEHGPVQVRHRHDLPAHVVVEPGDAVGVDQAVAQPQPGHHGHTHPDDHIKGVLYLYCFYLFCFGCPVSDDAAQLPADRTFKTTNRN